MTTAVEEVLALEQARQVALAAGDLDALAELMSDDLVHVHGTGVVHDKAALLNHLKGTARAVERKRLKVRIYGDTAILTGDNINRVEQPGEPTKVIAIYATQVAHKRDGRWRFVSFHGTRLPD